MTELTNPDDDPIEQTTYSIVTKKSKTYRTTSGEWNDKTLYEVERFERSEDGHLESFEIEILEINSKSPDYKGQIRLGINTIILDKMWKDRKSANR